MFCLFWWGGDSCGETLKKQLKSLHKEESDELRLFFYLYPYHLWVDSVGGASAGDGLAADQRRRYEALSALHIPGKSGRSVRLVADPFAARHTFVCRMHNSEHDQWHEVPVRQQLSNAPPAP